MAYFVAFLIHVHAHDGHSSQMLKVPCIVGCFKNVDMNSSPCTFLVQVQKCISMKICEKGNFFVKNPLGAAYFCDPDSLYLWPYCTKTFG